MRRLHFDALAPICPRCRVAGVGDRQLVLATVIEEIDGDVRAGILHCPDPACRREYPIVDGIPLLVPDVQRFVADSLVQLTARDDLPAELMSLFGDCAGSGSAFDVARQHLSIYAWDGYADLDPAEPRAAGNAAPGAVVRCLDHGLEMAGRAPGAPALDVGCAVGRSTFELAARTDGLVLGIDLSVPMLRLAQRVLRTGCVHYPRRRVGFVYDERTFAASFRGGERVDFWACDALALPFADGTFAQVVALNVLDCVAAPVEFLARLDGVLRPGGVALLSTPYDWSPAATPPPAWIGGHSQRGAGEGASEPLLRALLSGGGHPMAVRGLHLVAEVEHFPWHARLHDRSIVSYDVHVVAIESRPSPEPRK